MPVAFPPADLVTPTPEEAETLAALAHYHQHDSGYAIQQSTRPQTVGYSLVDSPIGQMAWIVDKFCSWMDCDGHPENVLTEDELLDNLMLYWLTASGASSARLYWEGLAFVQAIGRVELPTGVAQFPKEIMRTTPEWCEPNYNVTRWTTMPRGGHFAALEQPALLVDDLRAFFATVR